LKGYRLPSLRVSIILNSINITDKLQWELRLSKYDLQYKLRANRIWACERVKQAHSHVT